MIHTTKLGEIVVTLDDTAAQGWVARVGEGDDAVAEFGSTAAEALFSLGERLGSPGNGTDFRGCTWHPEDPPPWLSAYQDLWAGTEG